MQKAISLAQVALYVVILTPKLSTEIMKLDGQGLPWQGWVLGIGGSFACLILCEVYKPFVRKQSDAYQQRVHRAETAESDRYFGDEPKPAPAESPPSVVSV
jgi:hypothetical protein